MNRTVSKLAWSAWSTLAKHAARAYIAGPGLGDAMRVCRRLSDLGYDSTVGYWNLAGDSPQAVAAANAAALAAIGEAHRGGYLSVKAPPLGFDSGLLRRVVARAGAGSPVVHFDSHGPETADRTFAAIDDMATYYPRLGCTLPARWARSADDAERVSKLGLHVRVVKGQWLDPEHPDLDVRAGYMDVIDRLAGRVHPVAVATHDAPLARLAIARLRAAGTPCTLELLYGLPVRAAVRIAREAGIRIRVYVPYGQGWLPYSLSNARENPAVVFRLLRDIVFRQSSFPDLAAVNSTR